MARITLLTVFCISMLFSASAQQFGTLLVVDYDDDGLPVEGVEVFQGEKSLGKTNHVGALNFTSKVKGTITLKHPDYQSITTKIKPKKGASVELSMMLNDEVYQQRRREREAVIYDRSCAEDSVKAQYPRNVVKQDGTTSLDHYLKATIHYPKRAFAVGVQGTVTARVYIEADGTMSCVVITKSVSFELDNEAYRVLTHMSGWEPARKNGIPVASVSEISVPFVIEN